MNFKKLMIIVAVAVALIAGYKFFTRVDRSNPARVANAFVKAVKDKDASKAATYWVPDQAESWRVATADSWDHMRSNATELYFDRIPSDPAFGNPVTTPAGLTTIQSADKSMTLEMKQIDGKWYVAKM